MTIAMVTGASSGIGLAFARRLAADGHDLVLVARDRSRLEALAAELTCAAEVLVADLADDDQLASVETRLRAGDLDMLINNAGFGTNGALHEIDISDEDRMLRVNVRAVMRLCAAVLPSMVERGSGSILNISSMAGFLPGGGAATYAASKAYVTALSQSLATTYKPNGVRVLAVCPGFTRTEFHERAGAGPEGLPSWLWLSVDNVVDTAMRDLAAGRTLSIAGAPYKAVRLLTKGLPDRLAGLVTAAGASRRGRV